MPSEEIGAHSCSTDPRKLFLPDPDRKRTWLSDKAIPMCMGIFGYGTFALANYMNRLPVHAGGWRHILAVAVGVPVGIWYHNYREERWAEYDALMRWYIDQHPEEFPTPERKKVGDMFEEWCPYR